MKSYIDILIRDNALLWRRVDGLPCISKIENDFCYTICLFGKGQNAFVSVNVDKINGRDYQNNIYSEKIRSQDTGFEALEKLYFDAKLNAELIRA